MCFYLEIEEVLAFVDGRSTCTNLRALVALRKQEFRDLRAAGPRRPADSSRGEPCIELSRGTPIFGGRHAGGRLRDWTDERTYQVQGTGCSAGIVRGIVTIVRDPRTTDIAPGSILVAEHTDPGWIIVFPSALGVIVERGSQLSHAAIVARELGIPAVVSLRGATTWLRDGDWVEMDGATGVVRVDRASG